MRSAGLTQMGATQQSCHVFVSADYSEIAMEAAPPLREHSSRNLLSLKMI